MLKRIRKIYPFVDNPWMHDGFIFALILISNDKENQDALMKYKTCIFGLIWLKA